MIEKQETAIRQEQIAQAVLTLVAEHGLEGVRVSAVAREIGVVPSALYRHFANKEKMVQAALDAVITRFHEHADEISGRAGSPLQLLDLIALEMPAIFKHTMAIPRIVFGPGSGASQARVLDYVHDHVQQPLLDRISAAFRQAQAAGQVRNSLDPDTLALMFFGIFVTSQVRWFVLRGKFDAPAYVRNAWKVMRSGIVQGGRNGNA